MSTEHETENSEGSSGREQPNRDEDRRPKLAEVTAHTESVEEFFAARREYFQRWGFDRHYADLVNG